MGDTAGHGTRARDPWSRGDGLAAGLCALASGAVAAALWLGLGLSHPGGSDPDLWGLNALNMAVGQPSIVPPAYPALVAAVRAIGGTMPVASAHVASVVGALAIGPLVYTLARVLGARPGLAVAGVAALLTTAPVAVLSAQVAPDSWTAALFAAVAVCAWAVVRRGGWLAWLALLVAAGLAPMLREHGLIVASLVAGVAVAAPGCAAARGGRLLAVVASVALAPVLFQQGWQLPWQYPWFDRLAEAAEGVTGRALPKHAEVLDGALRERLTGLYRDGDRPGIVAFHAAWAVRQAPTAWGWVVLAAVGALAVGWRRRVAIAVGLLPALPALLIWSMPRHVAVVLPVAIAAWAAGASSLRRGAPRTVLLAAGATCWLGGLLAWPGTSRELVGQAHGLGDAAELGRTICEHATPGDLAAGELAPFLFCPLPICGPGFGPTDWRLWMVASRDEQPPGFEPTDVAVKHLVAYRKHPQLTGDERPCADSQPVPGSPYISLHTFVPELVPECLPDKEGVRRRLAELRAEELARPAPPPPAGAGSDGGPASVRVDTLDEEAAERARRERARPGRGPR